MRSKINERSQLKIGTILSYAQMALNIAIGLLYTPIMISLLGKKEYGLYNTVSSAISMLSLLSLGFNSGYIKYFSIYKMRDGKEDIYKLNGLFLLIFCVLGIIAFFCGIFLILHLELVFDKGLTKKEYDISSVLFFLLTIRLSLSFPMSVFSSIITAHERFVFLKVVGMVNTILSPLVTLPLLLMGYRSIAVVSVSLILSILVNFLYFYYTIFKLRQRFIFKGFEKGIFKNLFVYTSFIAINMIIDQINWNVDKILLARYKGTATVAVYSVGYMLYHYYSMLSTAISGVFTPRIHKLINETNNNLAEQRKVLTNLFTKVGRIQFLILGLASSGIIFFGKSFLLFWVGKGYCESYYVALLLIIPASIALVQNLGLEVQRAQNRHKFRSIAYIIMAVINLFLSMTLCQLYGAVGSALGTSISLIVANGLIMNVYYHRKCNIDIIYFWKNILKAAKGILIPIVFGIIFTNMFAFISIWKLFFGIVIYTLIYLFSMWLIGMNNYEKHLIIGLVKLVHHR